MKAIGNYQDVAVRRKRNLGNQRFYAMENVLRTVLIWFQQNHAQKSRMGVAMCFNMLTTNYINWEQYNTLYDADFAETGRLADRLYKSSRARDLGDDVEEVS
jgi:hypothetical protein